MEEIERMSPDLELCINSIMTQEEPRDLSVKRKLRPVPPPLDLTKRTLIFEQFQSFNQSPRSPFAQKNLPLRKRAYSWSSQPESLCLQISSVSNGVIQSTSSTKEISQQYPTCSSSSSSLKIPGLPTPQTPQTPNNHPHSAIPIITSRFNFNEEKFDIGSHPNCRTSLQHNQGPLNLSTSSMSALPSSLLSPAPSHPSSSSLYSSREELENDMIAEYPNYEVHFIPRTIGMGSLHQLAHPIVEDLECDIKPHTEESSHPNQPAIEVFEETLSQVQNQMTNSHMMKKEPFLMEGTINEDVFVKSETIGENAEYIFNRGSNVVSHQWPTSVWSVFMAGVQIHFVLGGGKVTGARLSEELGPLEVTHNQQYAPHGLYLLKIVQNVREGGNDSCISNSSNTEVLNPTYCQLFFRPVGLPQEDIMAMVPIDHPFYTRDKGWCSISCQRTRDRYGIPCNTLNERDTCLPPYHPEVTNIQPPISAATPDLADAMKKFDFEECEAYNGYDSSSNVATYTVPSATSLHSVQLPRSIFISPPASPSKKNILIRGVAATSQPSNVDHMGQGPQFVETNGISVVKSRRPMNGFMLFAKHHRLKLIQQYPGKDNRAISVLLGAMWKSLPEEERERFNSQARHQAEERKRIDPDCWKRKRSHSTS